MRGKLGWLLSLLMLMALVAVGLMTSCSDSGALPRSEFSLQSDSSANDVDSMLLVIHYNDGTTLLKLVTSDTKIQSANYYADYYVYTYKGDAFTHEKRQEFHYVKYYKLYYPLPDLYEDRLVNTDYFDAVLQEDLVPLE